MESQNHKIRRYFISDEERFIISNFVESLTLPKEQIQNQHIREVRQELKGDTWIYDITQTHISSYLAAFQSSQNVLDTNDLPQIFIDIKDRIAETISINKEHVFLQIIKQNEGGRIKPHYDTGYPGYINYKCNIAILSSEYDLFVEKDKLTINQSDLYCFEASLYKHWTEPFQNQRIILSYGFGLTYEELERDENDPRCRMSQRMVKYFQKM